MANQIKKFPVPLILKKIMKDKLTGELIVLHENYTKQLFFIKGKLAFATTTVEKERLGDVLMAAGKITKEDMDKLTKIIKHSQASRKVGEVLVDITDLTMQDIYYALIYQIKVIATSTFSMMDGEWRFMVKAPEIPNKHKFKIRIAEIAAEGVTRIYDPSYYKHRFALRAPVTAAVPENVRRYLDAGQMSFFMKLSTFSNEPVSRIIPQMDVDAEAFWRNLILMYLVNVVDFVEFTVDEDANRNIEEINELYEKVNKEKVSFYDLLGVDQAADAAKIKESYFNYSKKYHPDRIIAAPDSTVKLRANDVFAEINRAFETLSNKEKKSEYDARSLRKKQGGGEEGGNRTRRARSLYLKANGLFKLKHYYEASSLMEEAVQLDPGKASFYLLLGLCHSKLPATKHKAAKNLKKASELEPWNADHMFALGELYKSENLMKKAQVYFDMALEINMEHTLAGKAKEDLARMFGKGPKKPLFSIFGKKK
jgi:curved DNA-binding protein CbpA